MTTATLVLPYGSPHQNDLNRSQRAAAYERGRRSTYRGYRKGRIFDAYSMDKAQWATRIHAHVYEQKTPSFPNGARVHFHIVEADKRVDPDNFTSAATKFILDGLVKCGVLRDDGWKGVLSLSYSWEVGKPCVRVTLSDGKD